MAVCCVSITDTVSSGSCSTTGDMYGDVQIALHQVGNSCLRDSSGNFLQAGPVGDPIPIGPSGIWVSPPLCANSDIIGDSFYTATVRANGKKSKPVYFVLRADLSPVICGRTLRLSEVSLCGNSCVSGSFLCNWFASECCGVIDTGGGTDVPFSCSDLASCSITSLGDVPAMPAGGPWVLSTNNGVVSWASNTGGGSGCDSRGGVCSIIQNDGDTFTVQYADGTSQIVNIASSGGGGGTECCNTGGFLNGTLLTINQSNGSPITIDLSALSGGGGGTECCNTNAFLSGSVLTLNQSNGNPVTVDLSSLSSGTASQFYETISFQHSGPMTLNDSPEQNGWTACASADFSCGKLTYADDDGAGALNGPVTVQIYNCVTNAVLSQATLPTGSNECAIVDMPNFSVFTNDIIKWRFTAFNAADADGATISMTFQKLQNIG